MTTHGVFPTDALDRLSAAGVFRTITATDSHPRALALAGPRLAVVPVAPLFASRLRGDGPG